MNPPVDPTVPPPLVFTDTDYAAIRRVALEHLTCSACGRPTHHPGELGEVHGIGCGGRYIIRPLDPEPPWRFVDLSHGEGVVMATADPDVVDVFLIQSVSFVRRAELPEATPRAKVRRVRPSEAEETADHDSLCDQRNRLCIANAELGLLLLCMTEAVSSRRHALESVSPEAVRDYLTERGWTLGGRHPSGVANDWVREAAKAPRAPRPHGRRSLLWDRDLGMLAVTVVDREAGDAVARLWDTTIEALAEFEERDPTVILAYLLYRDEERARAARWARTWGEPSVSCADTADARGGTDGNER